MRQSLDRAGEVEKKFAAWVEVIRNEFADVATPQRAAELESLLSDEGQEVLRKLVLEHLQADPDRKPKRTPKARRRR